LDFDPAQYMDAKTARISDRFMHLAIAASKEAIEMADWFPKDERSKERTAVVVGSGIGGILSIEHNSVLCKDEGARRISPFFIPASLINLVSGHLSIMYGYKGANLGFVSACATGAHSIGEAMHMIRAGRYDVVVCGGTEAALSRVAVSGFAAARALSTKYNDDPVSASRPWDVDRDGFVIGEGAGILVLESEEHAKKRGAKIYGEILGYGASCDAHHITSPTPEGDGAFIAMRDALEDARLSICEVDYINAHGTSTPAGDIAEYKAVERIVAHYNGNSDVAKSMQLPIMSSTKSSIGHALGAAGGIEAVFSLLAMRDCVAPATLNLNNLDLAARGSIAIVANTPVSKKIDVVMSNSFGFGGTNASLIFGRYSR